MRSHSCVCVRVSYVHLYVYKYDINYICVRMRVDDYKEKSFNNDSNRRFAKILILKIILETEIQTQ